MGLKLAYVLAAVLALHIIGAVQRTCPSYPNCVCGGTFAVELNCNIDGRMVKINLLPNTYINIKCENTTKLDYSKLPKCANNLNTFKSVSFKDCPLPSTSFRDVLDGMGVKKTMSLVFQNAKNLSGYFDRKHFSGLQDLTKLLLSVNGVTHLPDNLFADINNLTWLNIRCNSINLSEELFKPLGKLETLEISHNHLTNMSSNLFAHLSFLRKLSLWQSNVTWFSKDFFSGVDVLEELDLSSNGLNELPQLIFKPLRKLKKLTLYSNKFSTLPKKLFSENVNLETVIILNNDVKIRQLPKYLFGSMPNLKQIYIQRCGLEEVPYDVFVNSPLITNISLAYNDIVKLPESVFNDQINLLELDLSHNNIRELEPKLFSSLVRLEKLNLCHNSIVEISGCTFSSLLSLIDLNMENNNLQHISAQMFSNNKQRMSISLAFNKLNFSDYISDKNSLTIKTLSPFAFTYNLKLLNLSHNNFYVTFVDWWGNGHETVDISYNSIKYLWNEANLCNSEGMRNDLRGIVLKKPVKEVWISNSGVECACSNIRFLDYIRSYYNTKVMGDVMQDCHPLKSFGCYLVSISFNILIGISFTCCILSSIGYFLLRDDIFTFIKSRCAKYHQQQINRRTSNRCVIVKYSENDEEFVLKEMLPGLRNRNNITVLPRPINKPSSKNFIKKITGNTQDMATTLVIFSPNYLTSAYSHVNIKKIRGEMLKAKDTIFVFTDIGPENSLYTFLKDQRDRRSTILWSESNFWNSLMFLIVSKDNNDTRTGHRRTGVKALSGPRTKLSPIAASFTKPSDWANAYDLDAYTHSQV